MPCPSCGKPARTGASFCGECGFNLSTIPVEPAVADAPAADKPLRRPPPPPPSAALQAVPVVAAVLYVPVVAVQAVVAPPITPHAAPILVPPPPANAPKVVEVVPSGTTEAVSNTGTSAPTITITSPPPNIADPPPAIAPQAANVVARTLESVDETRVSVRRRAGVRWRLVLPDTRHIEISTALLVGRDPSANKMWPGAALLTIDDDAHSVSKTHAVFGVDAEGLWVTDLDSTNGVVITQPDGTELDLEPNVRGLIQPGGDVELGDYVVQVEKD